MSIITQITYDAMVGDPDDHRPSTTWALLVDAESPDGRYVRDLTLLFERIAPSDQIPLHTHPIDEAIVIVQGEGQVTVGEDTKLVCGGNVVFVPAGVPHKTRNVGAKVLSIQAVFASSLIGITYLERNPAPGTEGDPPQPPAVLDARAMSY